MRTKIQNAVTLETKDESRRDFLKTAGKLALYTPPAMMMLMQPSRQALAGKSIRPGNHHGSPALPKIDSTKIDLNGIDLGKIDSTKVDWAKIDLKKVDWSEIDLNSVDWSRINWNNVDLGKIGLANTDLSKIDLSKIDWKKIDWRKMDWKKITSDRDFLNKVVKFISKHPLS